MASTTDDWSTDIAEVQDDDILIRGNPLTSIIGQRCSVRLPTLSSAVAGRPKGRPMFSRPLWSR